MEISSDNASVIYVNHRLDVEILVFRSNEQDDSEHEYDEDVCDEYGQLLEDHYKGTHLGSDSVERDAVRDFKKLLEAA
ncbi:hypothetical protein Dimus_030302 [Dionaea muscipula]